MNVNIPENNPIHLCYIWNMTGKNYHPENNINQNNNMVVLQIHIKYLNSNKSKLKEVVEMKKKQQIYNPHMKIERTKVSCMEVLVFINWLWIKISFDINYNIKFTVIATTNLVLRLKGGIVFNIFRKLKLINIIHIHLFTGTNRLSNFGKEIKRFYQERLLFILQSYGL